MSTQFKAISIFMLLLISIGIFWVPPFAQDLLYHQFADRRFFLIPNAWDVFSNLPFLIVGWLGLKESQGAIQKTLFLAILLTGFGSAYYHWEPNNATLLWDRLPIAIGLMSLTALVIAHYERESLGRVLFIPLVGLGIGSVVYWSFTESQGLGDLRAYYFVQGGALLFVFLVLCLYRNKPASHRLLVCVLIGYILAKVCEHFDKAIFDFTGVISGHTLKHLLAALAASYAILWVRKINLTGSSRVLFGIPSH